MRGKPSAPVRVVEALYAHLGEGVGPWLTAVSAAVRPFLDRDGLGVFGGIHHTNDPCEFRPRAWVAQDVSEVRLEVFAEGLRELSPTFIADAFLSRSCYRSAEVKGWDDIPAVQDGRLRSVGIADCLQLNATEPDGFGAWFGSWRRSLEPVGVDEHLNLVRVQRHLAAATRLLGRLEGARPSPEHASAILDPAGRVHFATGSAAERSAREGLKRAVRRMDTARCRRSADRPEAASDWEALVSGWWTLVDHFERGGRRYVLAIENRPRGPGLDLLSERERQIVQLALLGRTNKEIAYELELSHATVRVLVARSATKLGVRSRNELLARAGELARGPRPGLG